MLTVQQMADIAARHATAMADAMIAACLAWSLRVGEPLTVPRRASMPTPSYEADATADGTDWERMVRTNTDTRWQHT